MFYGTDFYGTDFYGAIISFLKAEPPEIQFCIREKNYNILKWEAPDPTSVAAYRIYRTTKTNLKALTLIKEVTTKDINNLVDNCYVDKSIDPSGFYLYQVTALDTQMFESKISTDFSDFFLESDFKDTSLYSRFKNSNFWKYINQLPGEKIFNKSFNVIPYIPNQEYLLVNYLLTTSPGQTIKIKINNVYIKSAKVVDVNGFIYCTLDLSDYQNQIIKIEMMSEDELTLYNTLTFEIYNLYAFYDLFAEISDKYLIEFTKMKGDLYKDTVRFEKVYDNFMYLYKFEKQPYWDMEKYFNVCMLEQTNNKGIFVDYLKYAGSYEGIKRNIISITGATPEFNPFKNKKGWIIRGISDPPLTDPSYLENPTWPIILYSCVQKAFSIELLVHRGLRDITESLTKSNTDIDFLMANNLITLYYVQGYTLNVDFTVDMEQGFIKWLGVNRPLVGESFEVSYMYSLSKPVEYIVENQKPAHVNVHYHYLI